MYFYNVDSKPFEIGFFPLMLRTILYFQVNVVLDFPLTYRSTAVICQSDCACLHKTVNMTIFFVKSNENT